MKRATWIFALTIAIFLAFGSWSDAAAKRRVYVKVAPPAAKVVVVKPANPYQGGVWVSGYWGWKSGKHVWVEGRWTKPRHGYVWIDGHWKHTRHGWEWIPGHWKKR